MLPSFASTALGLAEGENGFVLKRVRHIDGKAAMHSTNYLPADVGGLLLGKAVLEGQALVIGGVVMSTLLSLIVIPVIFTFVDDLLETLKRLVRRAGRGHETGHETHASQHREVIVFERGPAKQGHGQK